jgi:hypothetical protein
MVLVDERPELADQALDARLDMRMERERRQKLLCRGLGICDENQPGSTRPVDIQVLNHAGLPKLGHALLFGSNQLADRFSLV